MEKTSEQSKKISGKENLVIKGKKWKREVNNQRKVVEKRSEQSKK